MKTGLTLLVTAPDAAQPAVKAAPLILSKRMTVEQAFVAVAANCVAQIQANAAAVAQGRGADSLHQMRVGLRRLRSAFGLFALLRPPEHMLREWAWLGSQLGDARDWEVLAGSTLGKLAQGAPGSLRLSSLERAARENANDAYDVATAAVASPRYGALMQSFTDWLEGHGWREKMLPHDLPELALKVRPFARGMLRHNHRRLVKRGRKLRRADAAARHRVRIAAKKARYTVEFFASLFSTKGIHCYAGALSRLQDELGWLNDAAVADGLLAQLRDGQPDLAGKADFIRGYLAATIRVDEKRARKLWKKFASIDLPA